MTRISTDTMPGLGDALKPPEPIAAMDELHNALHWLARMAMSFDPVASAHDVSLIFDPARLRFATPEVARGTVLALTLPGLVLQFEEDGRPSPHAMDVDEKSSTEIEAWLLCEMLHRGFDRARFSKALPYALDRPLDGDERKYDPSGHVGELRRLGDALVGAAGVLVRARDREGGIRTRTDPCLVCWPEALEVGYVSPGLDGAAPLKVGYRLRGGRDDPAPRFFVRPASRGLHLGAPVELPLADASNSSASALAGRLEAMMAAARTTLAH